MSVDPGDGYRLLVEGELIPENAEWEKHKGDWIKADSRYHVGGKWTAKQWVPFRVPIKPIDNIGVEVTTSGPYVAIEVHRAALEEIERLKLEKQHLCAHLDAKYEDEKRLKAELDAVKQPSPEPEWFDLTPFGEHVLREDIDFVLCYVRLKWEPVSGIAGQTVRDSKEVGYTQFRCLLKDAPPKLVAKASKPAENAYGFCPICGAPGVFRERRLNGNDRCSNGHEYWSKNAKLNRPAEDPDEWVTQDRCHVRKLVDQFRWITAIQGRAEEWLTSYVDEPERYHGWIHQDSGKRLELRCRRRDLPPMPDKPKTETKREVLLYWYDGNVVGRYADCPPTDQSFIPLIVRDGKVFIETETREVVR